MRLPLLLVDAFTDQPFRGNGAGVCPLEEPLDEKIMQSIAAELNQAETAFVYPVGGRHQLRWFTPTAEVDLCGHATLATAHALWETGRTTADTLEFETKSGILTATRTPEDIELDFPSEPPTEIEVPAGLEAALGADIKWAGENKRLVLCELGSEEAVIKLKPDFESLRDYGRVGVLVTANGTGTDYDYISRFFAPQFGIPEDPVTGSAHCALAPYWSEKCGCNTLKGYQASKRGGYVRTSLRGDRVKLGGRAVTTVVGEIVV